VGTPDGVWWGLSDGFVTSWNLGGSRRASQLNLPRTEGSPFRLVFDGQDLCVVTDAGEVLKAGGQKAEFSFAIQMGAEERVIAAASIEGQLAMLVEPNREGSARLCMLDRLGRSSGAARLPIKNPLHRIVAVGGSLFLFDQQTAVFIEFSLSTFTAGAPTSIPSANQVLQVAGLSNSNEYRLVVVALQGSYGEVFVLDPGTGDKTRICRFLRDQHVQMAFADGKVIVAQGSSEPALNTIKEYELFHRL